MKKIFSFLFAFASITFCGSVVDAQVQVITTVVGNGISGSSGDGGPATAAELYYPNGVAVDGKGNIYITDRYPNIVLKVNTAGIISIYAGGGSSSGTDGLGDGGPATGASLYGPTGIAVDGIGNVYIVDMFDNFIRKVDTSGIISIVAGNDTGAAGSMPAYTGDGGPATSADLGWPSAVAVDGTGNIYIADQGNNVIRKVNTSGIISTVAGNHALPTGYSGDGGAATAAQLSILGSTTGAGIAADASGNFYFTDVDNQVIRKVNTGGIISTFAGNHSLGSGYSGDGGLATGAQLNGPSGLAVDGAGNMYIEDIANNVIRKVNTAGIISTVTGNYSLGWGYSGDGGEATAAQLDGPVAVAVDGAGNMYIDDDYNDVIRKVSPCPGCTSLDGTFYLDLNSDCLFDSGDVALAYWDYALINNTLGDTLYSWCDSKGGYSFLLQDSDKYSVVADPFIYFPSLAYTYGIDSIIPTCPASGTYSLTAYAAATESFAFSCTPPTHLDMTVSGWDLGFVPGDTSVISIWSSSYWDYICDSLSATLTFTLDPALTYVGMLDGPIPTISGSKLSWTFSTTKDLFDFYADVKVATSSSTTIGTPVCNMLYVTPTSLPDPDTANNTYSWCEPVRASFDPNEKKVSPIGTGTEGYIANGTLLSYLVHFQNTGTASAVNITIKDTINSNLNVATLQVLNSSSPVMVSEGNGNVVTFKFEGIFLPDSAASPNGSSGYVAYNIMPYPSLAAGTQITNKAAIYFDNNPAIYTNATLNTIEHNVGVQEVSASGINVEIYPNPVSDVLTIKTDANTSFSSFTISNSIGEVLLGQQITATQMEVNVKSLAAGVYYVTLKGESGVTVKKFVKE